MTYYRINAAIKRAAKTIAGSRPSPEDSKPAAKKAVVA
jgi:hypothetical protein